METASVDSDIVSSGSPLDHVAYACESFRQRQHFQGYKMQASYGNTLGDLVRIFGISISSFDPDLQSSNKF